MKVSKRQVANLAVVLYVICVLFVRIIEIRLLRYLLWSIPNFISSIMSARFLVQSLKNSPEEVNETDSMFFVAMLSTFFPAITVNVAHLFPWWECDQSIAFIGHVINYLVLLFYIYAVWSLGNSLTILPEYNKIKVHGAYKYSRHPLYLSYIIQSFSQILIFQSWSVIICSIIQTTLLIIRAKSEEQLLCKNNEVYREYIKNTGWIRIGGKKDDFFI